MPRELRQGIMRWIVLGSIVLSMCTIALALESTGGEPFIGVKFQQVATQVVAATAVAIFLAELIAYQVFSLLPKARSGWQIALALWNLSMLCVVSMVPWRYVADIVRYQQ